MEWLEYDSVEYLNSENSADLRRYFGAEFQKIFAAAGNWADEIH